MDPNEIVSLFGNGFFPCVMCGLLFWQMIKQNDQHKQETDSMKSAINSLEQAIIKLTDKLGGE